MMASVPDILPAVDANPIERKPFAFPRISISNVFDDTVQDTPTVWLCPIEIGQQCTNVLSLERKFAGHEDVSTGDGLGLGLGLGFEGSLVVCVVGALVTGAEGSLVVCVVGALVTGVAGALVVAVVGVSSLVIVT